MADSVLEQIAKKVVARISTVSKANGYSIDLKGVERPTRVKGIGFDHLKVAVIQHEPEGVPDLNLPGNPPATAWKQPFAIYLIIRPSEHDTTPDDEITNGFEADVQTAICQPEVDWHNWDGLAVDSNFGQSQPFITEDGSHSGRLMMLNVTYRIDENNPRNVRA